MIYSLNHEFSKVDETRGVLQNRSKHVEIEIVTCAENPRRDSGIVLRPMEKYDFCAREGEYVFARSNCMGGELANLAVLNFNAPAPDGFSVGVGAILYSHAVMQGWVKADGSLLKRSDYPRLAAFAEKNGLIVPEDVWTAGMYGAGDGAETFRLPDLRGLFLRALDDGAGIDEGRNLGGIQLDALQGHWHATSTSNTSGANLDTHLIVNEIRQSYEGTYLAKTPVSDGVNGAPRIDKETRPVNIALIAQIKY